MIQRIRLLLIDDDADFRELVAAILKKDFFVVQAPDGETGVSLAISCEPQVIVVDMQMPLKEGVSVVQSVRAIPRLRSVPILVLSSDSQRQVVLQARDAGADDYLLKNVRLKDTLVDRLRGLLSRTAERITLCAKS